MTDWRPIARAALPADTVTLARALIGMAVVRDTPEGRAVVRIVETEAYPLNDPASHAFRGLTPRTRPMFLDRGHAYVYLGYGTSWLLNVSSEVEGVGAGVLIRAGEPVEGAHLMVDRRGGRSRPAELTAGPGRLCQALAVDRSLDGADLCAPGPLFLATPPRPVGEIGASVRIGLTKAVEQPWRFFERDNPYLSGSRRLNQRL
ncbi:MAG: DNA-3-methyladenine glycosylase [Proteobacteria bacterium]|nr:DNA-3-methyladenine glycosylase [Pseudomonadota bacterium]